MQPMVSQPPERQPWSVTCYRWLAGALVISTVALHVAAMGSLGDTLWGVHMYRFFPPAFLWVSCLALCGVVLGVVRSGRSAAIEPSRASGGSEPGFPWVWVSIASAVFFVLCWVFREGHTLLGDGNPLTSNLAHGQQFHEREPLTLVVHHAFYLLARPLFHGAAGDPAEMARDTVALSSAIAGALFVPVLWGIARELVRGSALAGELLPDPRARALEFLVFFVLLAQGTVQLFFGYVENYTLYTWAIAAYALASLRFLNGRGRLWVPGALLTLAIALHLAAAGLLPSFALLAAASLWHPGRRKTTLVDLGITAVVFAGVSLSLAWISPWFHLEQMIASLVDAFNSKSGSGFARPTPLDFLNQQTLIGPLGVFLFVPALGIAAAGRGFRGAREWFVAAMGMGYLAESLVAGDSNLGVARNWDLLAPAGLMFTLSGVALALNAPWTVAALKRWLILLVLVSLFHTVPWIALNASFDRSFERFKTLPLGRGRTEATVGDWYLSKSRYDEAGAWFRRSLTENPDNNVAAFGLGVVAMHQHEYALAGAAFWSAHKVRPTIRAYRIGLVDAMLRGNHPDWAQAQLDTLLLDDPRAAGFWAVSSIAWLGMGDRDRSRAALATADQLAPGDTTLATLRDHLARPDGYVIAMRTDLSVILSY